MVLKSTLATLALMSAAQAKPVAQAVDGARAAESCGLSVSDPASWAASGGEKLLFEYLDKSGSADWLTGISKAHMGPNSIALNCASLSTNSCPAPTYAENCDKYDYFFVRQMSSQINSVFKAIKENLQDTTIETALEVSSIIEEFDIAQELKEDKTPGILKNVALGPASISAVVGFAVAPPAGPIVAGILALIAAAFGATADNIEDNKPDIKIPEANAFAAVMDKRLQGYFKNTRTELDKTLQAIFGKGDEEVVRIMVEKMAGIGVKGVDRAAKNPIAELLKGGEWLRTEQDNAVRLAMEAAFRRVQQGLIGSHLARSHVYLEQELPAWNEGAVPCEGPGHLAEGNSCLIIRQIPFGKTDEDRVALDPKYIDKWEKDYGINTHVMMQNVRDCNNGEPDMNQLGVDGTYPKCFFSMPFARRVHKKDHDFQDAIQYTPCVSNYQDDALDKIPEWIRGTCTVQVPKWGPCKVIFEETAYWTEGGLDRYRMGLVGEGVDIAPVCPYAMDGLYCTSASNRQCYHNAELNKWVFDVNFAKGPGGHNSYKECRDNIRSRYAKDMRCSTN